MDHVMPKFRRTKLPPGKKSWNGRPSGLDTLPLEQVRKLLIRGWTDADIADFFQISPSSYSKWRKDNQWFFEITNKWRDEYDVLIERRLAERAAGYSHPEEKVFLGPGGKVVTHETLRHYPPDVGACEKWLTNRKKWRTPKHRLELSGEDGGPIEIAHRPKLIDLEDFTEDELRLIVSAGKKLTEKEEAEEDVSVYEEDY